MARNTSSIFKPGQHTPHPWINVIANPQFGFLVSEAGLGSTWAENSGENRLTPWRNDPVTDMPGEALYLRDEETGLVWSPTPMPAGAETAHVIRHGAGYSIFESQSHGLNQNLRLFAAPDAPVKIAAIAFAKSMGASAPHHRHLLCRMGAWHNARHASSPYHAGVRSLRKMPCLPATASTASSANAWHFWPPVK